jgi:hypothetical protein
LADELRAAGFTVKNGIPPEHPDILTDEIRAVLWVSIEGEPGVRSLRHVRALAGRLTSQDPEIRVEIDEVPD